MKNDSFSNNAMARVYRTAVAFSALILSSSFAYAADPPVPRGNVSVNLNPTTGYYVTNNTTLRLPDGVRATPSAGASTVTKYSGGLKQSIPTGITIDAIKKSAPLSVTVRATTQSVKGAATRCLTSAKCNVALLLAGAGLDQLFDGLDWVMGDGGRITKKQSNPPISESTGCPSGLTCTANSYSSGGCGDVSACRSAMDGQLQGCNATASAPCYGYIHSNGRGFSVIGSYYYNLGITYTLVGFSSSSWITGLYANTSTPPLSSGSGIVNNDDIVSGVESNYVPEPSDWPALTPELELDDVEITWSPSLQGEPRTTTEYDADGNPHKIRETNIWYDFDIRDNPSPQPKLDLKKREETKTYEDGVLTGMTTTESTESAGFDDTPEPPPESPIDCDLFPTACAWFEWTKEEPTEPDDDLSKLLKEVPVVSETYTISGGAAACPAPLILDLSVFGSREVSYQPLCDLASTMKYLYLALMSFAAAVLLNRSINRV